MMIAKYYGTNLSKNIGRASKDRAFAKSKVESNWWWLLKIYRIGLDILFSSSLPELAHNYIYDLLMAINPTVSPEHTPAKQAKKNDIEA